MRTKTIATVATLWLGIAATTAQAATAPCLTESEAQSLFLAVAPDAIDAVGQKCAAQLAPNATLRGGLGALVGRYRVAADAAWPQASLAIAKIGSADMKGVDPAMLRPMIGPMIAQMATDKMKPADCVLVDRLATQLAPLPPANTASLIVVIAQEAMRDKGKANDAPFTICPAVPISAAK
ncbi:MAG: hypothetical protein J0I47_04005 [Sphingomonas sp.]|uniref:hypothetical protein n=1 Tax=Sphingomonas sp. TaxID=28214 RepID=UPI001AC8383F|nr:hypothetical protein [Sphingomonas sp.]MBN8807390.1 hypothetical protein [Sphingomonas sp.]